TPPPLHASTPPRLHPSKSPPLLVCPKCRCDDPTLVERVSNVRRFCNQCAHAWTVVPPAPRFRSIEELARVTGLRRSELTVLAEIGALNAFGHDRRSALWQAERAARPAGEMFEEGMTNDEGRMTKDEGRMTKDEGRMVNDDSPLPAMTATERLVADYAGTSLTIGPHPMAFRRRELAMRGVLRAVDLPRGRQGRRVRTAGMVITRQRPGTAKGFVFLTLEDESGLANIIVRPDLYDRARATIVESPFLLVDGILQVQDGVTAIRAERVQRLDGLGDGAAVESHDFH
ncbi:MAG: OB-fold nucleic acid binding domain-containing protein, partial [Acidobacteriota bacterium]